MYDPEFDPLSDLQQTISNLNTQARLLDRLAHLYNDLAQENAQHLKLIKSLRIRIDRLEHALVIEQATTNDRPRH
jgi:hypothetical protein